MQVFFAAGFEAGKWAGELAKLLRRRELIPDLVPKARVWRATWKQWVQFQQKGWSGPAFSIGKPGIVSNADALYAGYYVERGLPASCEDPNQVLGDDWHWHGFRRCLNDNLLRARLNSYLADLPEKRRCIWIRVGESEQSLLYEGEGSLSRTSMALAAAPPTKWIDVILGLRFSKEECLSLQKAILAELSIPIIRASEISELVQEARRP